MEEKRNSWIIGTIGALIGALVGTIPWILMYVYGNMIWSLLAFFVAMAALKGYELLKGKVDKKLPFIIASVSIIAITVATLLVIPNLLLIKEYGTTSLANFKMLYGNSEFSASIIGDYIMSLLFTVLGISGTIAKINAQVKEGKTKIDLNYVAVKVSDEEKEKIRSVFVKYNALDKKSAISKEIVDRELADSLDAVKYLTSVGIIRVTKKKYYFIENFDKKNLTKGIIIIVVIFAIACGVGFITASLTDNDNNYESEKQNEVIKDGTEQTGNVTYKEPKGYEKFSYEEMELVGEGNGWIYLPTKDLTGESGFIDVSYDEFETEFKDVDVFGDSVKLLFESSGYKVNKTDKFTNDNGYQVLVFEVNYEKDYENVYYILNNKKYGLIDLYENKKISKETNNIVLEMVKSFDWK